MNKSDWGNAIFLVVTIGVYAFVIWQAIVLFKDVTG